MTRAASVVMLAILIVCVAVAAMAQQSPAAVTAARQWFRSVELGMTREQVSKIVASQGPMELKHETWGRWLPGTKPGETEVIRVHFFDNRVYWLEYDAFGESWLREEKGGCSEWVRLPLRRLRESFQAK